MNEFYDSTGYPQTGASGSSASMRAELDAIEAGFNKLPTLAGNGGKIVKINAAGNAIETSNVISDNGTDANVTGDLVLAGGELGQNTLQKHTIPQVVSDVFALLNAAQTLINKTIVAANNTITTAAVGNLTSTNLNAALAELQADIDTRSTTSSLDDLSSNLSNHINDADDAHDASAISNNPTGNLVATNVQAALNELQEDIDLLNPSNYLGIAGGSLTGLLNLANGADIPSASTVDLTAATGNTVRITGTTAITAFTMNAGQQMELIAVGALPLTYNATTMNINGGSSYTCTAGDRLSVTKDGAGVVRVNVTKQDGTSVVGSVKQIQPITASVSSNALTITLNPTVLDFRSSSLTSGTVNTRLINSSISVVVSSGSTLGTVNAVQSRLAVLAIDNAGTVELAVVNMSGGNQLDETNLITTVAEGGAGGADSANVIYSTTARTNVPYRVVGYVESTQATAGTWATAPSTIQGVGGQALAALSSLGYGQTWQTVTGSRALATTYYNTTGRPIQIQVDASSTVNANLTITVNGVTAYISANASGLGIGGVAVVPPSSSYSASVSSGTPNLVNWSELR